MKSRKNHFVYLVLLAITTASLSCLPSYGASGKNTISSVKLTVNCNKQPEAGDKIDTVTVTTSNSQVEITEPAEYYGTEDDTVWIRGEVPLIRLTLSVKDSGQYRFTSSTKVTVSGFHSTVKSKKVKDGGDSLYVEICLSRVSGDLDCVGEWYWDGYRALWSEVDYADKYEVKLYRGSSLVTTVTAIDNQYYFYPYMNKAGAYKFKVRPLSTYDGGSGSWTERSEECYITADQVYTGSTPAAPSNSGWIQDRYGWMYYLPTGQQVKSSWLNTDSNWFHLAENGYMNTGWLYTDNNWFYLNPVSDGTRGAMKTGWQYIDNHWFYLNPVSDGTRGAMKTGWQYIDNHWFYLNPVSDGTRGAMKTGYQQVDGLWYFLDPSTGELWVNRVLPNGKWADKSGAVRG